MLISRLFLLLEDARKPRPAIKGNEDLVIEGMRKGKALQVGEYLFTM